MCGLHTSAVCCKVQAGRVKQSRLRNKPVTYEKAFKPEHIAHKKGWLSIHTGNLHQEDGAHQAAYEDLLIRQFIHGTFYRMIESEIIIKRRLNILEITAFVCTTQNFPSLYLLTSYSENFLSSFLEYNVKLHLLGVTSDDMIFKYV